MRRVGYGWVLLAVLSGAAVTPAAADSTGFRSPSDNIHCMYYSDSDVTLLRCDIRETTNTPPPAPADCDLDWGYAFEMSSDARHAERICHGDTVANQGLPVLNYGSSWEHDGFTCKSEKTGISCRNELGAGWNLAKAAQKLF